MMQNLQDEQVTVQGSYGDITGNMFKACFHQKDITLIKDLSATIFYKRMCYRISVNTWEQISQLRRNQDHAIEARKIIGHSKRVWRNNWEVGSSPKGGYLCLRTNEFHKCMILFSSLVTSTKSSSIYKWYEQQY